LINQTEDREREMLQLKDENVRNIKIRPKDVRGQFGLWDNVYDKRVIRALDCNARWEPNRKEKERRRKEAKNAETEAIKVASATAKAAGIAKAKKGEDGEGAEEEEGAGGRGGGGGEDDDPFAEAKKKWMPTGKIESYAVC
jgi:cation transport regulator ChaB